MDYEDSSEFGVVPLGYFIKFTFSLKYKFVTYVNTDTIGPLS